jgi:hypothetical protein
MRHIIVVVGSRAQLDEPTPPIRPREGEVQREITWYACSNQEHPAKLLDDAGSVSLKLLRAPFLAYRLYQLVHSTKLWSGKRPLILVRGRSFASRVAAHAGRWGGGDVVMPGTADPAPLGPTRFVIDRDGKLALRADEGATVSTNRSLR